MNFINKNNRQSVNGIQCFTKDAIEYIAGDSLVKENALSINESISELSDHERKQLEWLIYFQQRSREGYVIYHLTISYNEFRHRALNVEEIKSAFGDFYKKYFLKKVVGNNYTRDNKINKLPITVAFFDRHEKLANVAHIEKFADRYHIHAVIAAHPATEAKLDELIGIDTFKDINNLHCGLIKSTCLKRASEYCPAYAAKSKDCYDHFMIFGPPELISPSILTH